MTDEESIALVTRLVCKGRLLDPSQVSETTNLNDDLGFDSLDSAELLAALHKETGLQLEVESVKDMQTISDVARGLLGSLDRQEVRSS